MRVAVIDGLGHGAEAEAAANAAVEALRLQPELDPGQALVLCDRALRGTRGAAASVLWLDESRALFAGVGNVEGRILSGPEGDRRFSPTRGVLGRGIRTPRVQEFSLGDNWMALLHTDGLSSRFEARAFDAIESLDALAHSLLTNSGRRTDDATIILVRNET